MQERQVDDSSAATNKDAGNQNNEDPVAIIRKEKRQRKQAYQEVLAQMYTLE